MIEMLSASVLWLGTHFGLSSTPLRDVLVRAFSERGFLLVYSLIAALTLGWLLTGRWVSRARPMIRPPSTITSTSV